MEDENILGYYLAAIDAILEITDEMNDAEIDVRTTISQIRGMTDLTVGLVSCKRIDYERNSDTE